MVGRIGSGKTTVADIICKLEDNCLVIDVDKLAKGIYKKDETVIKEIKNTFGEEVFGNGSLAFGLLAKKVFSDARELNKLNRIMFPLIRNEVKNVIDANREKDLIVIDAAVLFDCKLDLLCDYIIHVKADKRKRGEFLKGKGLPEDEAELRINGQKIKINHNLVNFEIINNASIDCLKAKIEQALDQIDKE
ncbi:MAG: dephospho-CoA kinase [Actinomycetota bacterium]